MLLFTEKKIFVCFFELLLKYSTIAWGTCFIYVSAQINKKKEIIHNVVPLIKYTGSDDSQMLQFFFLNLEFRQCPIFFGSRTNHQNISPQVE